MPRSQDPSTQDGSGHPGPQPPVQDRPARDAGQGGNRADPPTGLAITALVLGIVAFFVAEIPVIGIVSFLLGPAAIVFGIIALRRKQRKALAVTGLVLGAVAVVVAAVVTAIVAFLWAQATGEHTVRYVVASDGPVSVSYFNGGDSVQERVDGTWEKEITYSGLPIAGLTVEAGDAGTVSCEIFMDGSSVSKNSGVGRADCASGNMEYWQRRFLQL
ncbi:DUF4190 domain-containing protein [Arthrobacter sp. E918]|uniref:DUF4190 domain-containing protein n=2 Tax=Arthrobacter mobilis TaxID=2724944 RepID=A0A7X6HAD0_9MICC|nr:DUF4190 domain-containing protein [Arthrobacter mobilis]